MKLNFNKLSDELLATGMHKVRVKEMVKQIRQDMIDWPEVYEDWDKCEWALEKGFIPGRVKLFGEDFNAQTYNDYYSDYDYFMAHPLNNHFAIWINDKLTLKYMLNTPELSKYMPEYYLYIENDGRYTYLMDAPASVKKDSDFLYRLLLNKKHLALKPNHGAGGMGFFSLKYQDSQIYMDNQVISREKFEEIKLLLNGYIVTEFIKQSEEMGKVFGDSDCTLRIILYKKVQDYNEEAAEYDCLIAYARFGAYQSNGASNMSRGGLAVPVDWATGKYEGNFVGRIKFWGEEGARGFSRHPDTGVIIDGETIPHWEAIKNGLLNLCNYLSSLDFFGMDVIVTEDGFKICEINSAPTIGFGQFSYRKGCLNNNNARKFVESKKRQYKKNFIDCFRAAIEEY